MNLANYENALSEIGFNLKTKALKSIITNNTKTFDLYKVNLTSFGETDANAKVWAAMLLNYRLNDPGRACLSGCGLRWRCCMPSWRRCVRVSLAGDTADAPR